MNTDYTAYCGLDREVCEARIATVKDTCTARSDDWANFLEKKMTMALVDRYRNMANREQPAPMKDDCAR